MDCTEPVCVGLREATLPECAIGGVDKGEKDNQWTYVWSAAA
ncbi:MAG TPA: hypothetical protein PLB18_20220 [Acidobacteriota bacterium]|nr:hypothetical protein [Acidobacteriota bacterium]HNJ40545.1 hypothetical protein [Acidobacteriota bacterium]